MPWWEKYNNIQTIVPGEQSVLYPNAMPGLVVPGDPGIPSTLSPSQYHNFAPSASAWRTRPTSTTDSEGSSAMRARAASAPAMGCSTRRFPD
jgi:hypothetical protein